MWAGQSQKRQWMKCDVTMKFCIVLVRGAVHSVCCTCAFRGNRKQMTVEKRSAEEEGERKRKVNEAGGETLNRK